MQAWIILFWLATFAKTTYIYKKNWVFYLNQEYYASYPQMFLGFSYIYHVEVG